MAGKPEVTVAFDGASRGNPGRAAIGVVVLKGGVPVREIGERIGTTTNNIAEYRALLRGLEEAAALGARPVIAAERHAVERFEFPDDRLLQLDEITPDGGDVHGQRRPNARWPMSLRNCMPSKRMRSATS